MSLAWTLSDSDLYCTVLFSVFVGYYSWSNNLLLKAHRHRHTQSHTLGHNLWFWLFCLHSFVLGFNTPILSLAWTFSDSDLYCTVFGFCWLLFFRSNNLLLKAHRHRHAQSHTLGHNLVFWLFVCTVLSLVLILQFCHRLEHSLILIWTVLFLVSVSYWSLGPIIYC